MTTNNIPVWFREHIDGLRRFLLFFKGYLRWGLFIYVLLVLLMTLLVFVAETEFLSDPALSFHSVKGALIYAQLVYKFSLFHWWIGIATISLVLMVPPVMYFTYFPVSLLVEGLYQLFAKESQSFIARRTRISRFLWNKFGKRIQLAVFLILCAISYLMISMKIYQRPPKEQVNFFVIIIAFAVPVVYTVLWGKYLIIRARKKIMSNFDKYLFSKQSIRRQFTSILTFLACLVVLGWILLYSLFGALERIERTGSSFLLNEFEYREKWDFIVEDGYLQYSTTSDSIAGVPSPDQLERSLSWLPALRSEARTLFPQFQKGMFFILTLASLFQIGIPSVISAAIYKDRRKALLGVFLATLKSTLLVGGLQLFIRKAFFVDISEVMGIGTVFLFTVSFFLMQQSVQPATTKRETESTP